MKVVKPLSTLFGFVFAGTVAFHFFGSVALAAESESGWRSNYDLIMMWVNFAILAFVVIKFGRNPIKGFLRDQKEAISLKISKIEEKKEANATQIQQARDLMNESSLRFARIKEKIIAEGEHKKQEIIESARRESQLMIAQANFWIDRQTREAKHRLKSELIDEVVAMAMQRLPQILTPEDNQKFIRQYLDETDGI
jgi:F-type H+-transporting ATPase subunit b